MAQKPTQRQEKAEKKRKPTISPRNGSDITKHQFKKGKPGGPGRPKTRKLREMLNEEISDEEWVQVIKKMHKEAMSGDVAAFKAIAEYRDGKAQQSVDVTSNGKQIRGAIIDYSESK